MKKILFDIETDGLFDKVSTVHVLVAKCLETGETRTYTSTDNNIEEGVRLLDNAELLAGHNIIGYDIPVLRKLYPSTVLNPPVLRDTLVISKLVYSDIKAIDFAMQEKWAMPGHMIGRHGLEAWGYRLGLHKGDYSSWCKAQGLDPWECIRPEMITYCVQDVELNYRLFMALGKKGPPKRAVDQEMRLAQICLEQEANGFPFDMDKAVKLYAELNDKREELRREVQALFPDWWVPLEDCVASRDMTRGVAIHGKSWVTPLGKNGKPLKEREVFNVYEEFTAGSRYTKVELREFNPSSRDHIANRLQVLYGWKPQELTKDGKPKLDDDVLSELPFPPCKLLSEYFMIEKRIGMLAEGKQAWIKAAKEEKDPQGRIIHVIHGRIDPIGTSTFRAAHKSPNMGQVPASTVPYGLQCRELFTTVSPLVLGGMDASGLELRCLAHRMHPFDGGAYIPVVLAEDPHWANAQLAGLVPYCARDEHNPLHERGRKASKTVIYCLVYGGGGWKIGYSAGGAPTEVIQGLTDKTPYLKSALRDLEFRGLPATPENIATSIYGIDLKAKVLKGIPALKELIKDIREKATADGYLIGLDGRKVPVRSAHSALNAELQSDGAIICKEWSVLLHEEFRGAGWKNGREYMQSAWSHDEFQIQFRKELIPSARHFALSTITQAGLNLGVLCPLAGEFKQGLNWAETH